MELFSVFVAISVAVFILYFASTPKSRISQNEIPLVTEGYLPFIGNVIPLVLKPRSFIENAKSKVCIF